MADTVTVFSSHWHTRYSNESEYRVRGVDNGNHCTDIVGMADALPPEVNMVVARTEHWWQDSRLYDDIREEVEARGGRYEQHERHAYLEPDDQGTRAAVIEGVEAAVQTSTQHVTVCGLPIRDDRPQDIGAAVYDRDGLYDLAREAAWVTPAHPKMPGFAHSDDLLDRFFQDAPDDVTTAVNYSTGYTPELNRLARGGIPGQQSVADLADRYDAPLVPEIDGHAAFPSDLAGWSVVDNDVMDALEDGTIPVDDLLGQPVIDADSLRGPGLSSREFLRTYPDVPDTVPGWAAVRSRLLPDSAGDFAALHRQHLDQLPDIDPASLEPRAAPTGT